MITFFLAIVVVVVMEIIGAIVRACGGEWRSMFDGGVAKPLNKQEKDYFYREEQNKRK